MASNSTTLNILCFIYYKIIDDAESCGIMINRDTP
jgi:hypothetical protein